MSKTYDYIIIGSGFGGSVSALRLSEKGYKVLVIEKGKWFKAADFPKNNWKLRKWLWMPKIGFKGIMKMSFFRHVSIISGVGVGGGSLVYANTLPVPKSKFFQSGSWKELEDWENKLQPFYAKAKFMLGATHNPKLFDADLAMKKLAEEKNIADQFEPTCVAVYFGEPNKEVEDPYFNGDGPQRTGCNFCGRCMTGCPNNSKNTLDKNYLYLAQKLGAEIIAEQEVVDVIPTDLGYRIVTKSTKGIFRSKKSYSTKGIVFSGGVLGTVKLLLKLKKKSLPLLSEQLGKNIRTNNEALILNVSMDKSKIQSKGVAIGSIINVNEDSHLEPVRYGKGSGFWRILMLPMVSEKRFLLRMIKLVGTFFRSPIQWLKVLFVRDFASRTSVLLFMQTIDRTLKFKKGITGMRTQVEQGKKPSAFIPLAHELAKKHAKLTNSKSVVIATETLTGIASTAHILGGCVMGKDENSGVINKDNNIFGYDNMYVCDGSMISANPGVNPSLTITAITEYAMSKIPTKKD